MKCDSPAENLSSAVHYFSVWRRIEVSQMENIPAKPDKHHRADSRFFLAILFALIGCTLFTGGTAVTLATGLLNDVPISVAQLELSDARLSPPTQ
jgi:hypothetical protein